MEIENYFWSEPNIISMNSIGELNNYLPLMESFCLSVVCPAVGGEAISL